MTFCPIPCVSFRTLPPDDASGSFAPPFFFFPPQIFPVFIPALLHTQSNYTKSWRLSSNLLEFFISIHFPFFDSRHRQHPPNVHDESLYGYVSISFLLATGKEHPHSQRQSRKPCVLSNICFLEFNPFTVSLAGIICFPWGGLFHLLKEDSSDPCEAISLRLSTSFY